MRVERGSRNSDSRVFRDTQVHVLTPLQIHPASHAKHFPEQHEPVSLLVVLRKIHRAFCLYEKAGLVFIRDKHHDNSKHREQELGELTQTLTGVRLDDCQKIIHYIYSFCHL